MNPAAVLALADQAGVSFSISAAGKIKVKGGREQIARLDPLIKEHKDALLSHLMAMEQGTETSLGTISSPSMAAEAKPSAPKEQSVLPLQPLQGVPLSDQEREDIAAGLPPAMSRRASEARVDTLEWLLGLETLTQEQAERVASFRRMDAALIKQGGKCPISTIWAFQGFHLTASRNTGIGHLPALFSSNLQANLQGCRYRKQSKMRCSIDAGAAGRASDGQGYMLPLSREK